MQKTAAKPRLGLLALALLLAGSPIGSANAASPREIAHDCDTYGQVTATITKSPRHTDLHFVLTGALPLEHYGFSIEYSGKGGRQAHDFGAVDGAGTAGFDGTFDMSGVRIHGNRRVVFRALAQSSTNFCKIVGIVERRKR